MLNSNTKLKILFTHRFSVGGGLINTHNTCNHLVALGHKVTCVFIKNKLAHEEPPMFDNPQYKIIWLESLPMICFWTLNRFLKSYLKKNYIDAIISTGPEGCHLQGLCLKNSITHIASYHHPNPTYGGKTVFLPNLKLLNPQNIGKWFHRWDLYFERLRLLRADVVRCVSGWQKNMTCKILGIPETKIVVIYNGTDIKRFSPHWNMKKRRILYCGGLLHNKGIDVLLEAFHLVSKNHNVSLHILGSGGEWELYRQKAVDLGIAEKVRYHGHAPYDEIGKHYEHAYLFVAPTKHESFGLTIAEAMASGLPVVSTSTTAIPELVQHGKTGILVPWNDSKALAEAIITLLDNPEMAKSMGQVGRERVEQMFTWNRTARQIEELIIQTLKFNGLIK